MIHGRPLARKRRGAVSRVPKSYTMYTLTKSERLCSRILFGELMASGVSFVKYPFRVVYKVSSQPGDCPGRIAISAGKKKFKRAVQRNRIKRLVRESYRLHKSELAASLPEGCTVDMLFIYLDKTLPTFEKTEKAVTEALQKIAQQEGAATGEEEHGGD